MEDPTQEDKKNYVKTLHEYRVHKLKTWLNNQRRELLKKDFDQRTKEIQALEQDAVAENWTDNYKKLKVKLVGEKIVATQKKEIKYHYSSDELEESLLREKMEDKDLVDKGI